MICIVEFIVSYVVLPIVCSILAAFFFWIFTFQYSPTNVEISNYLVKSHTKNGIHYKIKLINTGRRDLIDVTYVVRLGIKLDPSDLQRTNYYLRVGTRSMTPILCGKKYQLKNPEADCSWTLSLQLPDILKQDFQSYEYPDIIRQKAENNTLTLDDLITTYLGTLNIDIFVFGCDAVTGARKMFQSMGYEASDIVEGRFDTIKNEKYVDGYKAYIKKILSVKPKEQRKVYDSDERTD